MLTKAWSASLWLAWLPGYPSHLERTYEADAEVARIMCLVVGSEERKRSVGRALISAVEDWTRRRGAEAIMLTTHERRTGAHEFYRRMGYDRTGYRFYKELE
jgi:GNAT superfamily N-acetyltransferase